MEILVKYFIVPILFTTSGSDEGTSYICRVVDEKYNEIFYRTLNRIDTDAFISIMESDKNALLYRTHELLGELAYWEMDNYHKKAVLDGARYP